MHQKSGSSADYVKIISGSALKNGSSAKYCRVICGYKEKNPELSSFFFV